MSVHNALGRAFSTRLGLGYRFPAFARDSASSAAILTLLVAPGCAISRQTVQTPDVRLTVTRASLLRVGEYHQRIGIPEIAIEQSGCDQGVSGNATLGAVAVGALVAGPLGALAGGASAAAAEWARPDVSPEAAPCGTRRAVPPVPAP